MSGKLFLQRSISYIFTNDTYYYFSRAGFQSKRDDIAKEAADYFNEHNREVGSLTKAINDGKATHLKQSKKVYILKMFFV